MEVFTLFFKLGVIGFGGPAAHIALMEEEVVNKRKWMSREHFLDLMGATNLIPGPNSTEMTMHCGHERAGIPGLFVAGFSFIFPAVLITAGLAWFYEQYGQLPAVEPFIEGIKPAVLVVIVGAILKLGKKAVKNTTLGILGAIVLALADRPKGGLGSLLPLAILPSTSVAIAKVSTTKIFLTFLKVGAVLYGSGYVLFAYLDAELVAKGWLSTQQLMDAIAVGQFTPGPVLSTSTFVGYQLGGWAGAAAATFGMFLPSFLFVWILNPLIPKMRSSALLRGFLDSVNVAAVAVMVSVLVNMTTSSLTDWKVIAIAGMTTAFFFGFKRLSSMWLIVFGAAAGFLLSLI